LTISFANAKLWRIIQYGASGCVVKLSEENEKGTNQMDKLHGLPEATVKAFEQNRQFDLHPLYPEWVKAVKAVHAAGASQGRNPDNPYNVRVAKIAAEIKRQIG
jgi:hypothetical protein